PNVLVLQFPKEQAVVSRRRAYRGVLYTLLDTYFPQDSSAPPLIRELEASGITPHVRFAVLMVDESPWRIWKPWLKEAGAVISGMLIMVLLLVQLIGRTRPLVGSWRVARWGAAGAAMAWAVYFSTMRKTPVLPIGTILAFGLAATLGLIGRSTK